MDTLEKRYRELPDVEGGELKVKCSICKNYEVIRKQQIAFLGVRYNMFMCTNCKERLKNG